MVNYFDSDSCSVEDCVSAIELGRKNSNIQLADDIVGEIPIYQASKVRDKIKSGGRLEIFSEWAAQLDGGSGVVVIKSAYVDLSIVDKASGAFQKIIESERGKDGSDHFAKKGANDRVWNALEKLCYKSPELFAQYYANDMIAGISEAWLGPNYQMTSQINVVRPGGEAQQPHRDYHLGFQGIEAAGEYPAHVHRLSPYLTLQGAVAHCDMPIESGPTKLLPFSQRYDAGYMAYRRDDIRDYFEENCVQVPLEKGDLLFFSPAIFHAAGHNKTEDIFRMANLLQVSSAYGIAMESMNRVAMSKSLYSAVTNLMGKNHLSIEDAANAIACCADGYSFPTNLDTDPPVGGLAPKTQRVLMMEGLKAGWDVDKFSEELDALQARRKSS